MPNVTPITQVVSADSYAASVSLITFGAPPLPPTADGPPPSVKAVFSPPPPGRSDPLASIQEKGIYSLEKTDPNSPPARANSSPMGNAVAAGGAAALDDGYFDSGPSCSIAGTQQAHRGQ